jgi:hypothetical protein
MANEHPDGSAKSLWQEQDEGTPALAVGEIRRRAEAGEAMARRRRLVFGVSIVNNVAICAVVAWRMPPSRPFVAVFFLAVLFAQAQALTRSAAIAAPADAGMMTSLAFLRATLEREQKLVSRAWLWLLVPGGIGELALGAGMWRMGGPGLGAAVPIATFVIAVFAFVFVRSRQRARWLAIELETLG